MSDAEVFASRINEYVKQFGTESIKDVDGVLAAANMTDKKGSILPTDYCYNRYNNGLGDFSGPHLFEYTDDKNFRILGENYPYTGNVMHKPKGEPEYVWAHWINGKLVKGAAEDLPESILLRRDDLKESLEGALKSIPVTVSAKERNILINFQELLICGVAVEDETYKIFNASSEWADKTTYLCEEGDDDKWFYYLDSIDECIGECQRLVMFEAQKGNKAKKVEPRSSELGQYLTADRFEKIFKNFMEQADKNAISKKSEGTKMPYGMSDNAFDGADFCQQFGHGAASSSPHMNWWVVSIYYIVSSGRIVMGIEEDRYPHLNKMTKPIGFTKLGNRKMDIAVYYEANKSNVDYKELCDSFVSVCEEVIKYGLVDKNS